MDRPNFNPPKKGARGVPAAPHASRRNNSRLHPRHDIRRGHRVDRVRKDERSERTRAVKWSPGGPQMSLICLFPVSAPPR